MSCQLSALCPLPARPPIDPPLRWLGVFKGQSARIARDVSCMTGKPLKQAAGEVNTVLDRARTMVALAPAALADTAVAEPAGSALKRKITREPIGVVAVLCPWNYPLICAVRSLSHWSIR